MIAREFSRTALVALVLFGSAVGMSQWGALPQPRPTTLEAVVIETQKERARSASLPIDVLVLGDSSALMGLDMATLEAALPGTAVESLATIGFAGPRGHAHLLDLAESRAPDTVIVVFNRVSTDLTENDLAPFEAMATEAASRPPLLRGGTNAIYDHVYRRAVDLPLPGIFGQRYGFPRDLATFLETHQGTIEDPNTFASCREGDSVRFSLSEAFVKRLPSLRDALARARHRSAGPPAYVALALSPAPGECAADDYAESRRKAAETLVEALGLTAVDLLDTPAVLPKAMFASRAHLAKAGRERFSSALAESLSARTTPDDSSVQRPRGSDP